MRSIQAVDTFKILMSKPHAYCVTHDGEIKFLTHNSWHLLKWLVGREDEMMLYDVEVYPLTMMMTTHTADKYTLDIRTITNYVVVTNSMVDWWFAHVMDFFLSIHGYPMSNTFKKKATRDEIQSGLTLYRMVQERVKAMIEDDEGN